MRTLLALVLVASTLAGCGRMTGTGAPTTERKLTSEALRALQPTFKKGRAWTYVVTATDKAGKPHALEQTTRVVGVVDGVAELELTTTGQPAVRTKVPTGEGAAAMPTPKIDARTAVVNEGTEDVTVPAGTFKNATRVALTSSANFETIDQGEDDETTIGGGPTPPEEPEDEGETTLGALSVAAPGALPFAAKSTGGMAAKAQKGFGTLTLTLKATLWLVPGVGALRGAVTVSGGGITSSSKLELKAYKP